MLALDCPALLLAPCLIKCFESSSVFISWFQFYTTCLGVCDEQTWETQSNRVYLGLNLCFASAQIQRLRLYAFRAFESILATNTFERSMQHLACLGFQIKVPG